MSDLDGYLDFAKELALEAGVLMKKNFLDGPAREWKTDTTPLTATDTAVNRLVIEKVSLRFPRHSVLGEEESHNLGAKYTWACDPIDGTMPFSHALPIFTFSLALLEDGIPLAGVLYDPILDRLFWARKGGGAYLNDKKINVSTSSTLINALIDVEGFTKSTLSVVKPKAGFEFAVMDTGAHAVRLWSIALPTALIATGQFTATMFNVHKPEDGAACKVIVEEAGGKMTDIFGNEQRYDKPVKGFLASNGLVHRELLDLIKNNIEA